jgi:hypothetical protein
MYFTLKVLGLPTIQKGTLFGNSIDPYTLFPSSRKLRIQVLFRRVWGRLLGLGHLRVCGLSYCFLVMLAVTIEVSIEASREGEAGKR